MLTIVLGCPNRCILSYDKLTSDLLFQPPDPERVNEIEVDRASNSSWSIYSGNNEPQRDPTLMASTPMARRSKSKTGSSDSLSQFQVTFLTCKCSF